MKLADFMELSEGYTKSEKKLLNQALEPLKLKKKIEFLERESNVEKESLHRWDMNLKRIWIHLAVTLECL